jgi:hypothetical protein
MGIVKCPRLIFNLFSQMFYDFGSCSGMQFTVLVDLDLKLHILLLPANREIGSLQSN